MEISLVKIIVDDDGNKKKYAKWCAVNPLGDGNRAFCSGEVFGFGESGVEYELKKEGKVTCPECIVRLKFFKQYVF